MPLPTSDLRQPVCMEMKTMKTNKETYPTYGENVLALYDASNAVSSEVPTDYHQQQYKTRREKFHEHNREFNILSDLPSRPSSEPIKTSATSAVNDHKNDMGSVDSSDTYASCNTHPFLSEGDLTLDDQAVSIVDYVLDSNLYVNPLDIPNGHGTNLVRGIKKSASGDTALRNLGVSPMEETFSNFGGAPERGSRGSLNDSPIPKHRKTRFQQVSAEDRITCKIGEWPCSRIGIMRFFSIDQAKKFFRLDKPRPRALLGPARRHPQVRFTLPKMSGGSLLDLHPLPHNRY